MRFIAVLLATIVLLCIPCAMAEDFKPANIQTGSVALLCRFLDEVIRTGYSGKDDSLLKARDAGDKYLRDVLLPKWSGTDTFGRYYWDWENAVYTFGGRQFRVPIHDGPSRRFSQLEDRRSQHHCR